MQEFPLGGDLIDIMVVVMLIGWMIQKGGFVRTRVNTILIIYIITTFLSLLNGYLYLGKGFSTLSDFQLQMWKDYIFMPIIFFIVLNNIRSSGDIKKLIFSMSIIFLAVIVRFFSEFSNTDHNNFSEGTRTGAVFGFLGPNQLASFILANMIIFLIIYVVSKENKRGNLFYLFVGLAGFYPLLFTYSRGAYIAAAVVFLLLGIIRERKILVACFIILLLWHVVLPNSVVQRISMTSTSGEEFSEDNVGRLTMWSFAFDTFKSNPIFGIGFRAFENMELEEAPTAFTAHGQKHTLRNVHNVYLQTMAEMGIIGLLMFLYLFFMALRSGWQLYRAASNNFMKGLGLGFFLSVCAVMTTNMFGDRWYPLVIQVYYWMFWALVERGLIIAREEINIKGYVVG
jgi:O-antigen ligase